MALVRMQASMTADVTGALNPAICDFTFDDAGTTAPEMAAQVVQYLAINGYGIMGNNVTLNGIRAITPGSPGYTEMPYPADEVQAIRDLLVSGTGAWDDTNAWGDTITGGATGGSSGRGDSLCVTELTGGGGRSGIGKHFLPYISRDIVDSTGLYDSTTRSVIELRYRTFIMAEASSLVTGAIPGGEPVVYSVLLGTSRPVLSPRVAPVPSRLRSRTK